METEHCTAGSYIDCCTDSVSLPYSNQSGDKITPVLYKVIQEESSEFLEVTVSVIVRKNVHMNMCLFLNGTEIELFQFTNTRAM